MVSQRTFDSGDLRGSADNGSGEGDPGEVRHPGACRLPGAGQRAARLLRLFCGVQKRTRLPHRGNQILNRCDSYPAKYHYKEKPAQFPGRFLCGAGVHAGQYRLFDLCAGYRDQPPAVCQSVAAKSLLQRIKGRDAPTALRRRHPVAESFWKL